MATVVRFRFRCVRAGGAFEVVRDAARRDDAGARRTKVFIRVGGIRKSRRFMVFGGEM